MTIEMPESSPYAEELIVVDWLKRVGDEVEIGDEILQVGAGAHRYELSVLDAGKLSEIFVNAGQRVDAGQTVARLIPRSLPDPKLNTTLLKSYHQVPAYEPAEKSTRPIDVVHAIGWVTVVCGPLYVASRAEDSLRDYTPWIFWPCDILLFLIAIAIALYFVADGLRRGEEGKPNNNRGAIENWFRSHWPTLPAECRIIGIGVVDYRFHPIVARIRLDDGYGFTITLYYDLRTKQMLGCRASPSAGRAD
jgi:pyruvate/2-oxoglutarate dehydrogenase complex dihydrolipoamide acyltransferase (E2) component